MQNNLRKNTFAAIRCCTETYAHLRKALQICSKFRHCLAQQSKMLWITPQLFAHHRCNDFGHPSIPCQLHYIANAVLDSTVAPVAHGAKFACQFLISSDNHPALTTLNRFDATKRKHPNIAHAPADLPCAFVPSERQLSSISFQ